MHRERLRRDVTDDGVGSLLALDVLLLIALAVVAGGESIAGVAAKLCVNEPVFLALEIADLTLAVDHDARGNALHTARGQAGLDLFPEQRAELVAHDAVEDTARLLRVDEILIDLARRLNALGNDASRDLIEGHALRLLVREAQKLLQMPRDGLALAVRVGREIDDVRAFGTLFEVRDDVLASLDGDILRLKARLDVHAELALRQVAQMAHRGHDLVVCAEIFFNRSCLRRRLDDDEIRLCLCHRMATSCYCSSCFAQSEKAKWLVHAGPMARAYRLPGV